MATRKTVVVAVCLAGVIEGLFCTMACGAPSFQALGDMPGGSFYSTSRDVSDNGSVVVGYAHSAFGEGFYWTPTGGMQGVGDLPGGTEGSFAFGVSGDGKVVVGWSDSETGRTAFQMRIDTPTPVLERIGDLPGGATWSGATECSADGSVIVGTSSSGNGMEAYRWTNETRMVPLGDLPGGAFDSSAMGVSHNGRVVVGGSWTASAVEAFRWTEETGMVGLGVLPGYVSSLARDVSTDGTYVVGTSATVVDPDAPGPRSAFWWSQATGILALGDLPGGDHYSAAFGVTDDGSIVVGRSETDKGLEAFIWDETHGMRLLQDVLVGEYGLTEAALWKRLQNAHAISPDGLVIAGDGYNAQNEMEAWLVILPEPTTLSLLALGGLALLRRRR